MANEVKIYRKYVLLYMLQGLGVLILIFLMYLYANSGNVSAPTMDEESLLKTLRIVFYVAAGLNLVLILLLRGLVIKKSETVSGGEAKSKFLLRNGLMVNFAAYITAIAGAVLIFLGDPFTRAQIFFFISILLFYFSFIRYGRWADLVGIPRPGVMKK